MSIKLSVIEADSRNYQTWWINFSTTVFSARSYYSALEQWGGKDVSGPFIEFENDADATMFLLRFS